MYEDLKISKKKSAAVKRTSKRRTRSQTSAPMAPVRVLAPNPEASKRMFEPDEAAPVRVTRQKKKAAAVTNHDESNHGESLLHHEDSNHGESNHGESSLHKDDHSPSVDEEGTVHMHLSPTAPIVTRNQPLDSAVISEEPEPPTRAEGKFLI